MLISNYESSENNMKIDDLVFQNTIKVYFGKEQLENLPNEIKFFSFIYFAHTDSGFKS